MWVAIAADCGTVVASQQHNTAAPTSHSKAGSLQQIGGMITSKECQYRSGMHLRGLLYEDFVGGASAATV